VLPLGGDEFAVILPDTTEDHAAEVRRRICAATSAVCLAPNGGEVRMTCGTAELGANHTVETLLASADAMLLQFKNRVNRAGGGEAVSPTAPGAD
jgi:GGDEF domain-containing protein